MLIESIDVINNTAIGTAQWVWRNIVFDVPWSQNYFWGLMLISLIIWAAELLFPWRKQQKAFRHDFWLDAFYMYFNFFIFSIVISGLYAVLTTLFAHVDLTMQSLSVIKLSHWHPVTQLLIFFLVLDFLQWLTHKTLHKVPLFWRFHQVHHSIKEMGFAGHLRYHWMENILYKPLKTLGVMLLGGFEPEQAFIVHFFTIIIGHINHSNLRLDYGPLRYILNNPVMHLYHHAYDLPKGHQNGMNFGITLSVWDYLFKSAYVPESGGQIKLGYVGDENMPAGFAKQLIHGLFRRRS
jgi:sterol desaturase/sphingolipid hydroxylase (fatty acid hydroxylase superfamily)